MLEATSVPFIIHVPLPADAWNMLYQQKKVDILHLHEMHILWFRATDLLLAALLFLCLLLSQFSIQLSIQPLLLLQSHGSRFL